MSTILIKNARIVTMNKSRDIIFGNLLVKDNLIVSVGDEIGSADTVIDAKEQLLIPGLIQTHVHLCQTIFRGQADDMELLDWLKKRIWPLEGAHDSESIYYSAMLGIGELFKSGTTSVIDMETVHNTDSAFQALFDSGIRAISGKCMMDYGGDVPKTLLETTEQSLKESIDLLEKWHGRDRGRLSYAFTPRFAISCSDNLLKLVEKLSKEYKVKVHSHASENPSEIKVVESERGVRNIEYFKRLNLADENLILAHCIWVDDNEMDILRTNKVNVVHCPSSNLKLASGIAKIPEMQALGVSVSLGSDGAPCNNNMDMFNEMRLASLIHKPAHGPTAMTAKEVFEMATLNGAKAMGLLDIIGSIEPGKKADFVLVDVNKLHCAPAWGADVYSQLVYQARASDVALTAVDGKIVYQDGKLMTVDEKQTIKKCEAGIKRIYSSAFSSKSV